MSQSTTGKIAQQLRKIPGAARLEGEVKGAVAEERDMPIAGYDDRTAAEITDKLPGFSQIDLAKIDAYERKNQNRTTVLSRITTLRGSEPWPGYDELTVAAIEKALAAIDTAAELKAIGKYERSHKNRSTVISASEREARKATD